MNMKSDVVERFLRYVKIHTTSSEDSEKFPSTERQFDLANILVNEMKDMGITDAKVDEFCIVTGTIPANTQKNLPTVGFIAHMDTSPAEPGENVNPQIIEYNGGEITFPNNSELKITPEENPELNSCIGQQIITADGLTLLGADDKAGCSAIMAMAKKILTDSSILHGNVKLMFTPDEEVGKGTDNVDVKGFGADFAYTVDGGKLGGFEVENFNATNGHIEIQGYNVHPGSAYGKMINAIRYVDEIIALFPKNEGPETTKDRQGYYHPMEIHGDENSVKVKLLIRDFDEQRLLARMKQMEDGIQKLQELHPEVKYYVKLTRSYKNMKPVLDKHPHVVQYAVEAYKMANLVINYEPIRGGTDGARLSYDGLPTPNIFTGGGNFHSKKEFLSVYALEKAVEVLTNIVKIIASK